MINRRSFLSSAAIYTACTLASGAFAKTVRVEATDSQAGKKPNIIVIFTDDHGYADLQCQLQAKDIKTPNIDRLAREGVRCTDGYVTAPQCCPSRAGLMTGRYQQRFGLDENRKCPLPPEETTIADRLKQAGYATGMVGKWHLEPNRESAAWAKANPDKAQIGPDGGVKIPFEQLLPYYPQQRGFTEFFKGEMQRYWANYALDGKDLAPEGEWVDTKQYRLDVQSDAAVAFINRHAKEPFFLYLAYYAPHTPLQATEKYLSRFPGEMPERRRHALAMISAMDDGVGRILDTLQEHDLNENTLIFFISDNGAPLKLIREDTPVTGDPGGWDGSLNDPWVGEKGMLSEGGIRVPFVMRWKRILPEGTTYREPVISLDMAATAIAAAGLDTSPELDGANLVPYLTGKKEGAPHKALYWRFWTQGAVRKGPWKYLQMGQDKRYLFNLADPGHENRNVLEEHPDIAEALRNDLVAWNAKNKSPEALGASPNRQEPRFYNHYFGENP